MTNASPIQLHGRSADCQWQWFRIQLERCGSHHLDSHIRQATSACDIEEEAEDSDFPDLVEDSDEDEECNEDEEKEEEGEEAESGNGDDPASDTDASLFGDNCSDCFLLMLILHALNPIYFAAEEEIDPDGFDI